MEPTLLEFSVFILGMLFYIYSSLKDKKVLLFEIGLFVVFSLCLSYIWVMYQGSIYTPIVLSIILVAFFLFQKKLLRIITEETILINTWIYWYVSIIYFPSIYSICLLPILPSFFVFIHAFTYIRAGKYSAIFLYAWFLITNLVLAYAFFSYGNIADYFFNTNHLANIAPNLMEIGLAGMAITHISISALYVFFLIPFTRKPIGVKYYWKYLNTLETRYSRRQMPIRKAALICCGLFIVFTLNLFLRLIPDFVLVSFIMILSYLLEQYWHQGGPEDQTIVAIDQAENSEHYDYIEEIKKL